MALSRLSTVAVCESVEICYIESMVQINQTTDFEKIKRFYKSCGYSGGVKARDIVIQATISHQLVGVVRLCREDEIFVLRGMYVGKDNQKKGIGKQLLMFLDHLIGKEICYCIPYAYLEKFYNFIGFVKIKALTAPLHLQERLSAYLKDSNDNIIMKRSARVES